MNVVGNALQALTVTKAKLKIHKEGGGGGGGLGGMLESAGKAMAGAVAASFGVSVDQDPEDELSFKFNPTDYTISRQATWAVPTASGGYTPGQVNFTGIGQQQLTLEIYFDEFETVKGDVSKKVTKLLSWTRPLEMGKDPPLLEFIWGKNPIISPKNFYGHLSSVSVQYQMFAVDGTPLRANARITLVENVPFDQKPQNPTSGSLQSRQTYLVREGDSLHSIAYDAYGTPAYWRSLAAFNDIDDPLRITPGTRLLIPSAAEAARLG